MPKVIFNDIDSLVPINKGKELSIQDRNGSKRNYTIYSVERMTADELSGIAFDFENIGESDTLEANTVILERFEKEFYR